MEGVFSFFLESSFLGLFLFGEKKLGPRSYWVASFMMFLGSWLSGYLIVITNAWMQHPVGYVFGPECTFELQSYWSLILNPWGLWQYAHTMLGAVQTGSFTMAAVGAYYLLEKQHVDYGKIFLRVGVTAGLIASVLQLSPTGDAQGKNIARHQPVTLASMEGLFETQEGAPLAILGQPDIPNRRLDNPFIIPRALSFLTYRSWAAKVYGLDHFPQDDWPDNIDLLHFSYHIMVGLGTMFIAIFLASAWKLFRGTLFNSNWMLWILMLALAFPFIANTAGWVTAEVGRQPWIIYRLLFIARLKKDRSR